MKPEVQNRTVRRLLLAFLGFIFACSMGLAVVKHPALSGGCASHPDSSDCRTQIPSGTLRAVSIEGSCFPSSAAVLKLSLFERTLVETQAAACGSIFKRPHDPSHLHTFSLLI
jgi:hypothetical protein